MKRTRRLGDIEVAYDDQGQGPALVLLHPFPLDRRAWTGNSPALVAAGHRVIAFDYPGFGDALPPPGPLSLSLSIESLSDLVAALLDALAIETATLLGLSMGGYVALAFARRFPARLEALILADTRAAADGPTAREGRATALATIREQGVEAYLEQSLPRLLAPDAPAELRSRVHALAEKRAETLMAGIAALRDRPDRTAELANLRCPTLVLVGQADQVSPSDEMRTIAAAIPRARFVEIPGAGHLSNLEAPDAFNQAAVDFLRELTDDATMSAAKPAEAR